MQTDRQTDDGPLQKDSLSLFCCTHFAVLPLHPAKPLSIYPSIPCSSEVGTSRTEHAFRHPRTGTKLHCLHSFTPKSIGICLSKNGIVLHALKNHGQISSWVSQSFVASHVPLLPPTERQGERLRNTSCRYCRCH